LIASRYTGFIGVSVGFPPRLLLAWFSPMLGSVAIRVTGRDPSSRKLESSCFSLKEENGFTVRAASGVAIATVRGENATVFTVGSVIVPFLRDHPRIRGHPLVMDGKKA
jgi:hypothetical protein